MEQVVVQFSGAGSYQPTQIPADLRNAVETLFSPMKMAGYWDEPTSDHLCPQSRLRRPCPHTLPPGDAGHVPYLTTLERDLDAVLDVYFPHARLHVYLT